MRESIDMCDTCEHATHMPRMIQLRNVADDLHKRLKARAALEGMTLSDFLIAEVARSVDRPTITELRERLSARTPVTLSVSPARAVRAERDRARRSTPRT